MKCSHAVFVLAAAMLIGCSDAQTPTVPVNTGVAAQPTAMRQLTGTVIADPTHRVNPAFDLLLDDGTMIGLNGEQAQSLGSVVGATVEIKATQSGDAMLEVQQFLVLSIGGRDVSDGILELTEDGTYSLRLTVGGALTIVDPPDDLTQYVGQRLWIQTTDNGQPQAFGVIHS